MKYFSYDKTYEENRKLFLSLCNKHHPDKPTGNQEVMKEINSEWGLYKETHADKSTEQIDGWDVFGAFYDAMRGMEEEEEEIEEEYIMFKGRKYIIDENILQTIALRFGGLGLIEFTNSQEWQDHLNK